MNINHKKRIFLVALPAFLLAIGSGVSAQENYHGNKNDVLAITDAGDDSVRFFDAKSGKLLTSPVVQPSTDLAGPAGILFNGQDGKFIVVFQNFGSVRSEVIQYNAAGNRRSVLISRDDPNGPFSGRGAVLLKNEDDSRTLFVADQVGEGVDPGKLLAYRVNGTKVTFLGNLDPNLKKPGTTGQFHPRAIVLGPDGYLYVSLRNIPESCGGSILRFDPKKLAFKDILVSNPVDCALNTNDLHRPEGLVFSPDGDLYVTSFRKDPTDNDKILIISKRDRKDGSISLPLDRIDLYSVANAEPRAFAQALLFGPNRNLFVPISNTGEVRRYNVQTKAFWTFITPGRGLIEPQYLSFGKTNPATLAYEGKDEQR
jgi:DNA-binding beta-propeller fold protein YncE